jgi:hypothetical protein
LPDGAAQSPYRVENSYNKRHQKEMTMSDNAVFASELDGFLKRTNFPAGLSEADIRFQASLAVIVITSRASANLKDAYTIADLASQGGHGGVGPHKLLAHALKAFGIVSP